MDVKKGYIFSLALIVAFTLMAQPAAAAIDSFSGPRDMMGFWIRSELEGGRAPP